MIKLFSHESLRTRIMAYTGTVFLILAILIVASILLFVFSTEQEVWKARQSEAGRNAVIEINNYLERNEYTLYGLDSYMFGGLETKPDLLKTVFMDSPAFLEIAFLDKNGQVIQDVYKEQPILANQFTVLQSEWFQVAQNGEKYYSGVQTSPSGDSYLIFSMPSSHGGIVAAQIKMDDLWQTVAKIRFGIAGSVYIVNKQGQVIAHADNNIVRSNRSIKNTEFFEEIIKAPGFTWNGNTVNFYGERVNCYSAEIKPIGWILITELPVGEAYATSLLAMTVIPMVIIILMIIATLLYRNILNRSFLQPVKLLSEGAYQIGQGNLTYRIKVARMDELGRVMEIFNRMAEQLEKQKDNLEKAIAYEYESQRVQVLDILLKASEATSSSLDFDTVISTLASQLLEISGFESCFISEWDKETNTVVGRLDYSRTFWREDKRDIYSMADYPRSKQVLLSGVPIILQGNFEAEEKQWMDELKRTGVIILALQTKHETIGLVEIATTKKDFLFDPQILPICQEILVDRGARLITPLSANDPQTLFSIEEKLLEVTGGEVCSFSEWDRLGNRIFNLAVITNIVWPVGQGIRFNPDLETWRQAFDQGNTISFIRSEDKETRAMVYDGTEVMDVDSLIVFPLQKGHERIGVIELYDFNHRRVVTSEQITLLRTIADKASYSIENARLLQLTQNKLDEQITLLHEKEVLLKEIHHRVKNNLQIISSLLNLQSNYVKDPGSLRALHDSQARVRSMALIHEKLYQSNSLAKIDFGEYVQSLAKDLFRSYQRSLGEIELKVEAAEIALDLDYAIPCGLILNELLTNALKYAFPKGRKGQLWIELTILPDQRVCLKVADNGIGLPEGFDLTKSSSLGLQLVRNLVSQIEGKLELQRSGGTAFLISFRY